MSPVLTDEQAARVRALSAQGLTRMAVAREMDTTPWRVEQVLKPRDPVAMRARALLYRQRAAEQRASTPKPYRMQTESVTERRMPRDPIYAPDRDGELPDHETFTAAMMGDPRPGRRELMVGR